MSKETKFACAIIDIPWPTHQYGNYGAHKHYHLLPIPKIFELPIPDLMAENSHIYLWVTQATIRTGYDLLKSWGYEVKSVFTYVKPRMGLGQYFRSATEFVLFSVRGKLPVLCKNQPNWGFYPRLDHSHKPEEFHQVVMRMSPGPYAEFFARRKFPNWSVWGDEVEADFEVPGFPVPNSPETRKKLELKGGANA